MRALLKDACILIDLIEGSMLDAWAMLGLEAYVPDLVLLEVEQRGVLDPYFQSQALRLLDLSDSDLEAVQERMKTPDAKGLSAQDVACLNLAEARDMILVSGDGLLRKRAHARGIEVHGTLWLMELMVKSNALLPLTAADKLEHLLTYGRRLPDAECQTLLRRWRTMASERPH
jgi:predicted nucleic acid-binding protein